MWLGAVKVVRVVPVWVWIVIAVLGWGAFQKHRATAATHKADAAVTAAAIADKTAEAERAARAAEFEYAENARKAADAYQQNTARLRAAADRSAAGAAGLRRAIAASTACSAGPSASDPGRSSGAGVAGELLGQCAETAQRMAAEADRLKAKLTALQDNVKGR